MEGRNKMVMKFREFIGKNTTLLVFLAALFIYGVSAGVKLFQQSKTPQYIYLANSFLHGKVHLISLPESTFDLINFKEQWYVPGEITPALLLMPFVAVFGTDISDVLYGVILGAINVCLMYLLLRELVKSTNILIWLTALFGLGTVHWWVSSVGSVWFNAQLVALMFMILAVRASLKDQLWLAGLFLSLAFLSRPPTLFSFPFFILMVYFRENNIRASIKKLIPFGMMLIFGLIVMLAYNQLRFGNFMDFGYGYVQGSRYLTSAYALGGGFNIAYMPCNIQVSLFGLPNLPWSPLPDLMQSCSHTQLSNGTFGKISSFFNPIGMSMFLTTPAFLLIFRANLRDKLVLASVVGITSTLMVLWMYHTTGWTQFGYRYSLDIIVFIFLILAVTIGKISWGEKLLFTASFVMGAVGLYLMYYLTFGLFWPQMMIELLKKIYWIVF
jgi:hypothetical protein